MFAPSYGVVEDRATGSAAAAFTAVLARFGGLKDGEHNMTIEQGYEMGRPSVINVGLTVQGGRLPQARSAVAPSRCRKEQLRLDGGRAVASIGADA